MNNTKNRKKRIVCFETPYTPNISTNISRELFSLLGKHFSETHQLHKLFNCNNVKVS